MGNHVQKVEVHWNYLLSIENVLERISRYVEFDKKNFKCFSIEISQVLMTSAAEVDVVCKQICKKINPRSKARDIHQYRNEIKAAYSAIPKFRVLLPRYGLILRPWSNWQRPNGVPLWWTAYNKVKHHRDSDFHQGNLKNALNAVAGLFVLVLYLYADKARLGELIPSPTMLRTTPDRYGGVTHGGVGAAIAYIL